MASSSSSRQSVDATEEFKLRFKILQCSRNIERDIRGFLDFYQRYKEYVNRQEVERIIWTELPHFCFQKQLENSEIPTAILRSIHDLPARSAPNIVVFLVISASVYRTLSEEEVLERSAAGLRTFCYLSYYLHHATVSRLTLNGSRITETLLDADPSPFINIVVFSDPRCVLTLLQYGTRFYMRGHGENNTVHPIFTYALEFLISYGIHMGHFRDPDLRLLIPREEFQRDIVNACDVFQIFLRSATNPYTLTYLLAGTVSRPGRRPIPELPVLRPFYQSIFPGLYLGYQQPPGLKRLSRNVIRLCLNEKWKLPDGIFELSLPTYLLCYINLEED